MERWDLSLRSEQKRYRSFVGYWQTYVEIQARKRVENKKIKLETVTFD